MRVIRASKPRPSLMARIVVPDVLFHNRIRVGRTPSPGEIRAPQRELTGTLRSGPARPDTL